MSIPVFRAHFYVLHIIMEILQFLDAGKHIVWDNSCPFAFAYYFVV